MKAIIDGLRYDTERAERVAAHESGHRSDDFHYIEETLYRTENGRWFLHGKGGARTRYSESVGDGWQGGSEIRPLTPDEAVAWLEQHNRVQELETWFAEHILGGVALPAADRAGQELTGPGCHRKPAVRRASGCARVFR